ncbi:uncharacterized protein BO80DRAFT_427666 [Aspergillus ibericus CBS 121593]|uniref:Uncharacterized protein n=1 Tax=Aspergillus ibericus CBS 121593 TaxID=1448316 RepID=A0A395GU31_9EURO|nr:hypothetical protein BO80DRAFT_427666 [Aspergillus ibericus CBS 121593]RAK98187.1 hypothetical protein BO80DRAFT_427666 [Aspergillus ibericus CBS 121593]
MAWFPSSVDSDDSGWHFDVLILLAVIGGSAIAQHIPAITASSFSILPRLMPAPETFLETDRKKRMPGKGNVKVVGVNSGTLTSELNYFANLIHDVDSLQPYEFKVYDVKLRGTSDVENNHIQGIRGIRVKHLSWSNAATVFSVLITIGLFIAAGVVHDGVALLALSLMALSSSAASTSAWWTPKLSTRTAKCNVPQADLVIITRGCAMVVVKCDETVSRELYVGMDVCDFSFTEHWHHLLLCISTLLLMVSVVLFNNCRWQMQVAIGAAYFLLNIQYWLVALLVDPKSMWDLSRYDIREVMTAPGDNFTKTLWLAIQHTGSVKWAEHAAVIPQSEKWKEWQEKAENQVTNFPAWDAVGEKDRLFNGANAKVDPREESSSDAEKIEDPIPIVS